MHPLSFIALVSWVGWKSYRRNGQAARERFAAWVAQAQPQAAQVLQALRSPIRPQTTAGTASG